MEKTLRSDSSSVIGEHHKLAFEDFLDLDSAAMHVEWVNGDVVEMSPVTVRHDALVRFLTRLIGNAAELADLGVVHSEPYVMRAEPGMPARSPDLIFIKNENIGRLTRMYLDGPADLVIEVVSSGSVKVDTVEKRLEFEQSGVPEYWIIDSMSGETSFLVLNESGYYQQAALDDDGRYLCAALDGLPFEPAWFSQEPLPKVMDIIKGWGLLDG